MIEPKLAAVRPRVLSSETADSVLLEDEVLARVERRQWGPIKLFAAAGCGKTTALAHLAKVLGPELLDPDGLVLLVDEPDKDEAEQIFGARKSRVIVYTGTRDIVPRDATILRLARWGLDECIEYLLTENKERCASVMARFQAASDRQMLAGVAELYCVVLDRMAADEALGDCRAALRAEIYARLSDEELQRADLLDRSTLERLYSAGVVRLLLHEVTRTVLAADRLAADLRKRSGKNLALRLSRAVVMETASIVGNDTIVVSFLRDLIEGRQRDCHAMAGSLLWTAGIAWKPSTRRGMNLAGAYLANISWPGVQLANACLSNADLSGADLSEANLDAAHLTNANLSGTRLHGARMQQVNAVDAQFQGADLSFIRASNAIFRKADLSGANLEGALLISCLLDGNLNNARLVRANLHRAVLNAAQVEGADFTGANLEDARLENLDLRSVVLDGACLNRARLSGCNMEGVTLCSAQLISSRLDGALLTGSTMHGGVFCHADLRNAGLADIEWERADLRDADLRGATFHLGSSRSGLVGSPIASEGSRTGFYTDEYHEQEFKSPEEIRKANLCGADLRGARIVNVDFYLVDLRGAKYTEDQMQHFLQCRAILHARV